MNQAEVLKIITITLGTAATFGIVGAIVSLRILRRKTEILREKRLDRERASHYSDTTHSQTC